MASNIDRNVGGKKINIKMNCCYFRATPQAGNKRQDEPRVMATAR